jgi:hypothetical protein
MSRVGQFKKGGGRVTNGRSSSKKRSSSTALVRYVPSAPVVRYKTRTKTVAVRSKSGGGRSLMKREHGGGGIVPGPFRMRSAAIAALVGYSDGTVPDRGLTMIKDLLDKLPVVGKVPPEALAGLLLNYFAERNEWVDAGAQALLDIGGYKFGQAGFEFSAVKGEDDY